MNVQSRAVRVAHMQHAKRLASLQNVSIVFTSTKLTGGEDTGIPCITIGVKTKYTREEVAMLGLEMLPSKLFVNDGAQSCQIPTDVIEVGILKAPPDVLSKPEDLNSADDPTQHQAKFRPQVPGGVSAIVCGSSACTITLWVWSGYLGMPVDLQCWHCIYLDACSEGLIIQPSPYDGGQDPADAIAKILAGNIDNPTTDSAIATAMDISHVTMNIFGLGSYLGAQTPAVGDLLIKSGRTTGITTGKVLALDGVANIQYPDKVRQKEDLIVTEAMLQGGDSSSPALKIVNNVIQDVFCGQGFAGSDTMSLFVKPENIIADPALGQYKLDFNHSFEPPTPHPNPPGGNGGTTNCETDFTNCVENWNGQDWMALMLCVYNYLTCKGLIRKILALLRGST